MENTIIYILSHIKFVKSSLELISRKNFSDSAILRFCVKSNFETVFFDTLIGHEIGKTCKILDSLLISFHGIFVLVLIDQIGIFRSYY